jgi:hypothetical protein
MEWRISETAGSDGDELSEDVDVDTVDSSLDIMVAFVVNNNNIY